MWMTASDHAELHVPVCPPVRRDGLRSTFMSLGLGTGLGTQWVLYEYYHLT